MSTNLEHSCDSHTHLFLDANGSKHLQQVMFGVLKKLLHLYDGLQLMKLLNLRVEMKIMKYFCTCTCITCLLQG